MTNQDEELLAEDPEGLAIEADEELQYQPETDSNVVAVEPIIITKARAERKRFLKNDLPKLQDTPS